MSVILWSLTHSPISESRRVLHESCEFFLKHNSRVQHKKKHYNPSSHKLKVISKSMGTSTRAAPSNASATATVASHGTSVLSSHEPQCSVSEASVREHLDRCTSSRSTRRGERDREREGGERPSKGGSSSKISSHSENTHKVPDGRYVTLITLARTVKWFMYEIPVWHFSILHNSICTICQQLCFGFSGWHQGVSWSPMKNIIHL